MKRLLFAFILSTLLSTSLSAKINANISTMFHLPNKNIQYGYGVRLEKSFNNIALGAGVIYGENKDYLLSEGAYGLMPLYIQYTYKVTQLTHAKLAVGYSLNFHNITDHAIIVSEKQDNIANLDETLGSAPFLMIGASMMDQPEDFVEIGAYLLIHTPVMTKTGINTQDATVFAQETTIHLNSLLTYIKFKF